MRTFALPALVLTLGLLVTGCDSGSDDTSTAAAPSASVSAPAATTTTVSITDPWIKAADTGMTAAFGTLVNNTDEPLTVVSATSDVSVLEMHEMVMKDGTMLMQPRKGGFTLPARGTHELSPGGDHLMFMALKAPLKAGDEVPVTLTLSDGTTVPFTAVAKPFSGAEESYDPGMPMSESPSA